MANSPTVSVVLVIRDVEGFLGEAIESILSQTFTDFEFIIVDFGSKDSSKEIALRYAAADRRIKVSAVLPSSYIQAKIEACKIPTGRYIAIQDADDISLPDRLKLQVEFLDAHQEYGMVGGAVQWIDLHGQPIQSGADYPTDDSEIRVQLKTRNTFWHPTVLMRRETYERVGGYRAAFSQSDDYDLWLRIVEHYRCANLKAKVLHYRIHPQQLSLRKRKDQILCALAAQAAAGLRAAGKPDPLDATQEITGELLIRMGVSEAEQQKNLASGYSGYINHIFEAGGYAAVPEAVAEMLKVCQGPYLDPRLASDMHMLCAKSFWKQRKVISGLISATRAVRTRPRLLGRPLRLLVERLHVLY